MLGAGADIQRVETYVSVSPNYPAIMTRPGDTELLGLVQAGLESVKADGTLARLLEQWGLPAPPF